MEDTTAKNAPGPETCPHCGQALPAKKSPAPSQAQPGEEGPDIEALAKKVLPEVMKIITPLVEKLQEGVQQQQKELQAQSTATSDSELDFQERVQSLQQAALERMRGMEQKITNRLGRIQQRTGL